VSKAAINATLPPNRESFVIQYGGLVGSGEQGFIQLLLDGVALTKACTISPCFRDEETFDELHHGYFMKLELINTDATINNLRSMIKDACMYFEEYMPVKVVETAKDTYDIVDQKYEIELGSYGFRVIDGYRFIYGTGLALPRLDTVRRTHIYRRSTDNMLWYMTMRRVLT
jgi:hypothetical protein